MNQSFKSSTLTTIAASLATVATITITPQANALTINGFTSVYDPTNFTLTNTDADGSIDTTGAAGGTVILTGGDDGTNFGGGTTDWTILIDATRAGTIQFDWSFVGEGTAFSAGLFGDRAGYLVNGVLNQLASQDGDFSTSPVIVNVGIGDTFGFRVETADNLG
jgi:hypothetical protein